MASGTKIGDAYIDVNADSSKAKKELSGLDKVADNLSKKLGISSQAFKGAAIAGAAVVAGKAIVQFAADSVKAASDLGESINAINVQYGESASAIHALGEESAESFGLSQRAFNDFATQFSAFGEKIATASGTDIATVVDDLTTRIADFASVMNLDMSEAAVVFQSALAGETESFRRFGGDVSAAAVSAKALELGLGGVSGELTEQDKILARYELLMEQTEKTAGDFANTSDSLANSQRILAANLEDTQAQIGKFLVPVVADATGAFADLLNITSAYIEVAEGVADSAAEAGGGNGVGVLLAAIGKFVPIIGPVVSGGEAIVASWQAVTGGLDIASTAADGLGSSLPPVTESVAAMERKSQEMGDVITARVLPSMGRMERTSQELDSALADLNDTTYDAVAALDAYQNKLRAAQDPFFALREAMIAQEEAETNLTEARKEFGRNSPEYEQALVDQAEAHDDVFFAQQNVRTMTDQTRDAFIDQRITMGDTRAEAELLAEVMYGLEGIKFTPKVLGISIDSPQFIRDLVERSRPGGESEFASGGRPPVGVPVIVGEQGRELFVPDVSGTIIPHSRTEQMLAGTSSGVGATTNLYFQNFRAVDPSGAAERAAATMAVISGQVRSSSGGFQP